MQTQKRTLLGHRKYDVQTVKIGPLVRCVHVTKEPKKKDKEPKQWQTGYSPRPSTLSHRDAVVHGGWPLGDSVYF